MREGPDGGVRETRDGRVLVSRREEGMGWNGEGEKEGEEQRVRVTEVGKEAGDVLEWKWKGKGRGGIGRRFSGQVKRGKKRGR